MPFANIRYHSTHPYVEQLWMLTNSDMAFVLERTVLDRFDLLVVEIMEQLYLFNRQYSWCCNRVKLLGFTLQS